MPTCTTQACLNNDNEKPCSTDKAHAHGEPTTPTSGTSYGSCWRDPDQPFRCDSGYRPSLTDSSCGFLDTESKRIRCVKDSSYTTVARCEAHVSEFCQDRNAGAISFFFVYMVWELIATIIYAVAACKAAKVPPGTQTSGTQMQMQHASAQAMPHAGAVVFATAVAQPVAAVPMAMPQAQAVAVGSPMPQQAVMMGTAEAVPCSSNPLYSGG